MYLETENGGKTSSMIYWSDFMVADPGAPGWISGDTIFVD
jgi:hypothetical protein